MFDIIGFLEYNQISYTTEKNSKNCGKGWVNIQCPFCNDHSDHGGCHINPAYYNCWRCGNHSLVDVIITLLNNTVAEAFSILKEYHGETTLQEHIKIQNTVEIVLPGEPLQKIHKQYLRSRRFDADYLEKKYQLKGTLYTPLDWNYRIMIPIYNNNILVSYQGRDYTNKQQLRYKGLSSEKSRMSLKDTLYGVDNINNNSILVVEGVFDVWRIGDGAVATFGTSLSDTQIRTLSMFKTVYFLFDEDDINARDKVKKYILHLRGLGVNASQVTCGIDRDPAEFTDKEVTELRRALTL